MYYFFGAVILAGLAMAGYIVLRKFPQLSNLDLTSLPEEVQRKRKREILSKRIEEQGRYLQKKWARRLEPVRKFFAIIQLKFRVYVGKVEKLWYHEQTLKAQTEKEKKREISPAERELKITQIMRDAEAQAKVGAVEKAEELYIAAIGLSRKYAPAYRGLGDIYADKGAVEEARETYRFVLQLEPDDDSVMVKLAEIAENQGDLEEAIQYYQQAVLVNDALSPRFYHLAELLKKVGQPETAKEAIAQAVELEPKNPKYLDLLIETAIICGDKLLAQKGYSELRLGNPENQKLEDFKERISHL